MISSIWLPAVPFFILFVTLEEARMALFEDVGLAFAATAIQRAPPLSKRYGIPCIFSAAGIDAQAPSSF